jgi:DNA-binding NtrC family response regulator
MDVLVVDDEALVREIVSEGLSDDGLAVVQATSAEHALALTEAAGAPDVVVTDLNLGEGMNGLALAEEVHRRWPDTGVVIMSGNPAGVQAHTFGEQERFLTKPFGNGRLGSAVRELMGRSAR